MRHSFPSLFFTEFEPVDVPIVGNVSITTRMIVMRGMVTVYKLLLGEIGIFMASLQIAGFHTGHSGWKLNY